MVIGSSWWPENLSLPSLTQWLLRNTRVCKGLHEGGNWIKRVRKRIELDQKFDEIGYQRDENRITVQFTEIANSASNVHFCNRSDRDQ